MSEQDYGLIVSQPGYDAKDCPDRFLAFSSSFQTLKIYNRYSVSTTVPASGVNTITINHNLGFYAPFVVLNNGSGKTRSVFMSEYTNGGTSLTTLHPSCRQYQNSLEIDVRHDFEGEADGTTVYFTVYIFYDNFSTVTEENINVDTVSAGSAGDYGLRISKDGYDVKNCTDDQLAFSSAFSSQKIHKKGSSTATTVTISHNLSYVPAFLAFKKHSSWSHIKMMASTPYVSAIRNSGDVAYMDESESELFLGVNVLTVTWDPIDMVNNYSNDWATGYTFYYIIFKDKING